MTITIRDSADVVKLTDFLTEHKGETVELHMSCSLGQDVCHLPPPELLSLASEDETLAFLYRDQRCTHLAAPPDATGPCVNKIWWVWAIVTNDTRQFVTTPGGAGTFAFDGLFDVRVGFRTTLIGPEYVTTAGLIAVRK